MTLEDRTPEAAVAHIGDASRHAQAFPTLTPREIDRIRRFGTVRWFSDRTAMLETGKPSPGMFVLLSGHVAISQHDGLGHVTPVVEQGAGQFMAEVGTLSGGPALFLFCGADPATAWLKDCGVTLDGHGFVVTGASLGNAAAPPLQSSVRGVFAVGDVRSGSVKRRRGDRRGRQRRSLPPRLPRRPSPSRADGTSRCRKPARILTPSAT